MSIQPAPIFNNAIGVHALVFSGELQTDKGCETAVAGASKAGYDLLEVPLLESISVDIMRKKLQRENLKVSCSLGLSFEDDISNDNLEIVKKGETKLLKAVQTAAQLGSRVLTGVTYSALGKYKLPRTKKGVENCVRVLQRVAKACAQDGIRLGLEPCNRYETNVINTVEDALDLIAMIGNPENMFVHPDIYHMNIEESNIVHAVLKAGQAKRLGYVHLGASHRGYLGSGNIDFPKFLQVLVEINYQGPLVFESFSSKIIQPQLSSALAIWREMWTDSHDIASSARKFIDAEWTSAIRAVQSTPKIRSEPW